jgi:hypothetical protein
MVARAGRVDTEALVSRAVNATLRELGVDADDNEEMRLLAAGLRRLIEDQRERPARRQTRHAMWLTFVSAGIGGAVTVVVSFFTHIWGGSR